MKRILFLSMLGLSFSAASSDGQAAYLFSTYLASPGPPAGVVMSPISGGIPAQDSDGFTADLLWNDGARSGDLGLRVPTSTFAGSGSGWINDLVPVSFDPAYTGGPITLTIEVFGPFGETSSLAGSETWTEPGMVPGSGPQAFQNLPQSPIYLFALPEPTSASLIALGGLGLIANRRRCLLSRSKSRTANALFRVPVD